MAWCQAGAIIVAWEPLRSWLSGSLGAFCLRLPSALITHPVLIGWG